MLWQLPWLFDSVCSVSHMIRNWHSSCCHKRFYWSFIDCTDWGWSHRRTAAKPRILFNFKISYEVKFIVIGLYYTYSTVYRGPAEVALFIFTPFPFFSGHILLIPLLQEGSLTILVLIIVWDRCVHARWIWGDMWQYIWFLYDKIHCYHIKYH